MLLPTGCPSHAILLRQTIWGHLRRSQPENIFNVFEQIRLRFFWGACDLASAGISFPLKGYSDRLLGPQPGATADMDCRIGQRRRWYGMSRCWARSRQDWPSHALSVSDVHRLSCDGFIISSSIRVGISLSARISSLARDTGSVNRLGPALPGLTNRMPWRSSIRGR